MYKLVIKPNRADQNPQFLTQLASHTLPHSLVGLTLASGKLPAASEVRSLRSLSEQESTFEEDQSSPHLNWLPACGFQGLHRDFRDWVSTDPFLCNGRYLAGAGAPAGRTGALVVMAAFALARSGNLRARASFCWLASATQIENEVAFARSS